MHILDERTKLAILHLIRYCSDNKELLDWVDNDFPDQHIIHSAAHVEKDIFGVRVIEQKMKEAKEKYS